MARRPGRPCVTSMHRDLIPVASKGAGHLGALVYLELRILQDLAWKKGLNVRSTSGVYIREEEENTSWNNGPARERLPAHLPRELVSMAFVIRGFLKELPPWLLPPKASAKMCKAA